MVCKEPTNGEFCSYICQLEYERYVEDHDPEEGLEARIADERYETWRDGQ
jgi:hypothetical protein